LEIRPVGSRDSNSGKRNRSRERLSSVEVAHFVRQPKGEKSRLLHDGAGLYLIGDKRGGLSWVYKVRHGGRYRTLGLGPWPECDLATARRLHAAARSALKVDHVDPILKKREDEAARRLAAARAKTFKQVAEAWLTSKQDGWRSRKATLQPKSLLKQDVTDRVRKAAVRLSAAPAISFRCQPILSVAPARARSTILSMSRELSSPTSKFVHWRDCLSSVAPT